MDDGSSHLTDLVADLQRLVEGTRPAEELRPFASCLQQLRVDRIDTATGPAPFGLSVCRFWDAALQAAGPAMGGVAARLGALGPRLTWTQNPNYRRAPPTPTFLDNYGYAVIAGPPQRPPALLTHATCAFGVLLLGPETHYPLHRHPATEIYVTLNTGEWRCGNGPWRAEPAGSVIYHPPDLPHATRTAATPMIAFYLWIGDLATHARIATGS